MAVTYRGGVVLGAASARPATAALFHNGLLIGSLWRGILSRTFLVCTGAQRLLRSQALTVESRRARMCRIEHQTKSRS